MLFSRVILFAALTSVSCGFKFSTGKRAAIFDRCSGGGRPWRGRLRVSSHFNFDDSQRGVRRDSWRSVGGSHWRLLGIDGKAEQPTPAAPARQRWFRRRGGKGVGEKKNGAAPRRELRRCLHKVRRQQGRSFWRLSLASALALQLALSGSRIDAVASTSSLATVPRARNAAAGTGSNFATSPDAPTRIFPPAHGTHSKQGHRGEGDHARLTTGVSGRLRTLKQCATGNVCARATPWIGEIKEDVDEGLRELRHEVSGPRADVLILLLATATVVPAFRALHLSPILGFLLTGCLLGPNGLSVVSDVHTIERLAEFGIVFFLFEMGIELSLERLVQMKRDVFGLGLAQMGLTAAGAATLAPLVMPGLTPASRAVVGSGLALSSSAFVLQLLRDKDDMNTRHGRAAFGILLFQDLSVVPLLVAIPLLSGGTKTVIAACRAALIKSVIALGTIAFVGRFVLEKIFLIAAKSKSQEAFLALILLTVTGMSILTEGLGLSNTLGAFLAGVLLSETKYRYQVEADIAPFRGLLLGLFFITVGFSIDCSLLVREAPRVVTIVTCLTALKALTITVLCKLFKMSTSQGMQAGLLLAQGGEFAFVAFRLAESLGILTGHQAKTLLTSTAITMACTPGM